MQHSSLIDKYLLSLQTLQTDLKAPVLDLACGKGRNGLYLVENNVRVNFADVNGESLEHIKQSLRSMDEAKQKLAQCWQADFEQNETTPLKNKKFSAVMVFRYLHRPLFEQIKQVIKPGGIIIYETFTVQNAQFGRPKNPKFLLKPKELVELFSGWKVLHSFEGVIEGESPNHSKQAIAQIVAVKPQ